MRTPPASGASSGSRLKGILTSYDVGETMKQLGFAAVIEAKSGDMEFDLKWPGAPTGEALSDGRRATCRWRSGRVKSSA